MEKIIQAFGLSLLPVLFYVFLYTPSGVTLFQNTDSNHDTSGGFGPNQVSTVLGLGGYAFFVLFLFFSKNLFQKISFAFICFLFLYRITILIWTYIVGNYKIKNKIKIVTFFALISGFFIFSISVYETNELLLKRYTGKDAIGKKKESMTSGREDIAAAELNLFMEKYLCSLFS